MSHVGSDVSNMLEFSADALDLFNGLFEPLLIRRLDESSIAKMLGGLRRENVSQFVLAVLPRPFGNRQRPRGVLTCRATPPLKVIMRVRIWTFDSPTGQ
jgi:hypothetical protein